MGIFDKIKSINSSGLFSFTLTRDQLQEKVNAKFPVTYEKYFSSLTLTDPCVTLSEESDKIGFEIKAIARAPLVGERTGRASVKGILVFVEEKKSVCISDLEIMDFSIDGVSGDNLELIKKLAQVAIDQKLKQISIYELSGAVSMRMIKSVSVKEGRLIISVGV